jgi:arylsulfatase A-like enzyme
VVAGAQSGDNGGQRGGRSDPMMISAERARQLFLTGRVTVAIFYLMTSLHCLLAFLPYTYFSFILAPPLYWLPLWAKYHPYLYWGALGMAAATLWPDMRAGRQRAATWAFLIVHGLVGLRLLWWPVLEHVKNDLSSLGWSLAALATLGWLSALDHGATWRRVDWSARRRAASLPLSTGMMSALLVSLLCAGMAYTRSYLVNQVIVFGESGLLMTAWSVVAHILLGLLLVSLLNLAGGVAERFPEPARARFVLYTALAGAGLALLVRQFIHAALTFQGKGADFYAVAFSAVFAATVSGLVLRWRVATAREATAAEASPRRGLRQELERALVMFVLAGMAFTGPALIAGLDWNFLIQKVWVIVFWAVASLAIYHYGPKKEEKRYSAFALAVVAAASVGAYAGLAATQPYWPRLMGGARMNVSETLERYAGFDVSFKVVNDLFRGPAKDPCDDYCGYLTRNTNIPNSVEVKPIDLRLVEEFRAAEGPKPNIIVVVFDSLRADYTSPYNPEVDFTPNLAALAGDGIVVKNAFTRYAGTSLAVPSIWSGAMQLHKHYIQPFRPLNSLLRLVEGDGYQSFVMAEPVLAQILDTSPPMVRLQSEVKNWPDFDLCETVQDFQQKMGERRDRRKPLFFFAQPSNVHMLALQQWGSREAATRSYPGFDAVYAGAMHRADACLGQFVRYLKANRLYDNSILVVTSDHGDAFTESDGRRGHSSILYPEVLKIPLIVHLPAAMRAKVQYDPEHPAFNIDVTPSLYYLLGHRPIRNHPVLGRPLFTETLEEQAPYLREHYLVASDYAANYGLLLEGGKKLFVVDTVNHREMYFDLESDPKAQKNLAERKVLDRLKPVILHDLKQIANFYDYGPKPETFADWLNK